MVVDAEIRTLQAEIATPSPDATEGVKLGSEPTVVVAEEAKETRLAEAIAEKQAAVSAETASFQRDIDTLGERESALLSQRLDALRSTAVQDISYRFDLRLRDFDSAASKYLTRVDRYVEKMAARDHPPSIEDQVKGVEGITSKAIPKMQSRADDAFDEIDDYRRAHAAKEDLAVKRASTALHKLVSRFQVSTCSEYLIELTIVVGRDWIILDLLKGI